MSTFDPSILSEEDRHLASQIVGGGRRLTRPDLVIAPDGEPYLYRWHVVPRNEHANVYFHIQVASDPERPLHDHPWDNTSVILSGGYREIMQYNPPFNSPLEVSRAKGDLIKRQGSTAHRLILPEGIPYTMTLFTTGPVNRRWGFWCPDGHGGVTWKPHEEMTEDLPDGRSVFKQGGMS